MVSRLIIAGSVVGVAVLVMVGVFLLVRDRDDSGDDSAGVSQESTEDGRNVRELVEQLGEEQPTDAPAALPAGADQAPVGIGEPTANELISHPTDEAQLELADSAAGVPYHVSGDAFCEPGAFSVRLPKDVRSVSGGDEVVYWAPVLFQYTTAGWQTVSYHNWGYSVINGNGYVGLGGLGQWAEYQTNAGLLSRPFRGLAPGYYGVNHVFYWSNGGISHLDWSGYCYVS